MGHNGNPNSLKNLERGRWIPGQSGNPTGRAKGVVYPSELLDGLLAMDDDGAPRYTQADLLAIVDDKDAAPERCGSPQKPRFQASAAGLEPATFCSGARLAT